MTEANALMHYSCPAKHHLRLKIVFVILQRSVDLPPLPDVILIRFAVEYMLYS